MSEKKIEPTDAMVDEAADAVCLAATDTSLSLYSGPVKRAYRTRASAALRAALNHPDARGLFTDEDALRAARELGWDNAAEWMKGELPGVQWAADALNAANPYRPAQELPTEPGAVIVPADGREYIEATVRGETCLTREAIRSRGGGWYAAWRFGELQGGVVLPREITPGTWKVADQ